MGDPWQDGGENDSDEGNESLAPTSRTASTIPRSPTRTTTLLETTRTTATSRRFSSVRVSWY